MLIHTLIALLKSSIAGLDPAAKDNAMQAIADLNADAGGTANPKRQRTSHYGTFEFCNDNYFIHSRSTYAYRSPPLTIRFSPVGPQTWHRWQRASSARASLRCTRRSSFPPSGCRRPSAQRLTCLKRARYAIRRISSYPFRPHSSVVHLPIFVHLLFAIDILMCC